MAGKNLSKRILQIIEKSGNAGVNKSEIARALAVKPKERAAMRKKIVELLDAGKIVPGKKGRLRLKKKSKDFLNGVLRIHGENSHWFYVDMDDASNKKSNFPFDDYDRIRVGPRSLGTALNGDRIRVKWFHNKPDRGDRRGYDGPMARVEEVLERRKGSVIGTLRKFRGQWFLETDDVNMPPDVKVRNLGEAKEGQKVALKIISWDERFAEPLGDVVEVLGWPGDPGIDILGVIEKHNLRVKFTEEVMQEALATPEKISEEELKRRIDWRDKMVITIDPKTAKDHDDAVWVEKNAKGWKLAVHIADVSHYVKPKTAMDAEAQKRGNSTYLVDRVLPMLPEQLSNGICSLRPNEDRLTKCAVINFSENGEIKKFSFEDAVINSPAKLSYEEAQEMLDGQESSPLIDLVKEAWTLASVLRKRRFENGALDLDFPEVRVLLDEDKKPIEVKKSNHTASHQLIEEFMLVANEVVAKAIRDAGKPCVYRIHEDPDPDRLNDFAETAIAHGYKPGDLTNKKHIQALLDSAKGKPEEHAIKLGLLKSLNRAAYSPEPLGHYGLSKSNYAHFTSPIRRYADLIVHRSLQTLLKNPPAILDKTPSFGKAVDIAKYISTTERTSAEAENETHKMKMLEYLDNLANEKEITKFDAIVTEVRPSGLFVEATDLLMKGMIKREDIGGGSWEYKKNPAVYKNRKGGELVLGQNIFVRVKRIDRDRGFVDFAYVE